MDLYRTMTQKQKNVERIKVYVRFKPLKLENLKPIDYSLKNNEDGMQTLYLKNEHVLSPKGETLQFKFDEIFPSTASQSMVFEKVASPMVDKFVQKGVNCTIFSYGQTGSGKTYTICGLKEVNGRGIIHQTFGRLFDHVQASNPGEKYEIKVSFIEIYNDQIRDLSKSKSDSSVILFNTNITRIDIKNESSAIRLFENIKLKRKKSETNRNEHSSRSHLICTIYLTKYDRLLKTYDAEFNLVDLAGSERYDNIENKTTQFESRTVNESLYHLRQVTKKLSDPNFKGSIPYRTSRLTWALENTLGGECRVALIANVHSFDKCLKETVNTLEFATDIASIEKRSINTIRRVPNRKKNCYGQSEYVEMQLHELDQVGKKCNILTTEHDSLTAKNELLEERNTSEKKDHDYRVRRANETFESATALSWNTICHWNRNALEKFKTDIPGIGIMIAAVVIWWIIWVVTAIVGIIYVVLASVGIGCSFMASCLERPISALIDAHIAVFPYAKPSGVQQDSSAGLADRGRGTRERGRDRGSRRVQDDPGGHGHQVVVWQDVCPRGSDRPAKAIGQRRRPANRVLHV